MDEDTAALIGGTLINLVGLLVGEQASLSDDCRRPVSLIVDGFHTMPGADYESILSELAKYGASLILATQSLARLEALDRDQGRSLRATVFANLDGLFAFHTSAEDARYLIRELGDTIDEHDLIELGEHQCYARLSAGGERLPTFSVSLDPPPAGDAEVGDALVEASAARYGRDARVVDEDLRSALARIEATRAESMNGTSSGGNGSVGDPAAAPDEQTPSTERPKPRNEHRDPKRNRGEPSRATSSVGTVGSSTDGAPDLVQGELGMDVPPEELAEAAP